MRTLIRILNSSLLITYLQYLCFLCFTGNICSEFQLSSFSPQWLVISLSFHISGFRFRWLILGVAVNGSLCLGQHLMSWNCNVQEQREAESEISFQVQVLGMNLTIGFQKEKARVRWVRKAPTAFRMLMTALGGSTRANILFNIFLQSSDKF